MSWPTLPQYRFHPTSRPSSSTHSASSVVFGAKSKAASSTPAAPPEQDTFDWGGASQSKTPDPFDFEHELKTATRNPDKTAILAIMEKTKHCAPGNLYPLVETLDSMIRAGETDIVQSMVRKRPELITGRSWGGSWLKDIYRAAVNRSIKANDFQFVDMFLEHAKSSPALLLQGLKLSIQNGSIEHLRHMLERVNTNTAGKAHEDIMNDAFYEVITHQYSPSYPFQGNPERYQQALECLCHFSSPKLLRQLTKNQSVTEKLITGRNPYEVDIDETSMSILEEERQQK